MKLLLCNDDGYQAAGINALFARLSPEHDILMLAPKSNRSCASQSLTVNKPIQVEQIGEGVFAADASPADCAYLGLRAWPNFTPDCVVSGINHGANLGDDVLYSGTIGAAMEGRHLDLPNLAVSICSLAPKHLDTAAEVASRILPALTSFPDPSCALLSVNIPDASFETLQGICFTRLGYRQYSSLSDESYPNMQFHVGALGKPVDMEPGTDFYAIKQNQISVTPFSALREQLAPSTEMQQWLSGISFS